MFLIKNIETICPQPEALLLLSRAGMYSLNWQWIFRINPYCHSERSEESKSFLLKILRHFVTQNDICNQSSYKRLFR